MEVMTPSPPRDFNFDSTCTSPYMSASSSPQRFSNFFFSAPTSPTRVTPSEIPFNWEEKPGIPKSPRDISNSTTIHDDFDDDDFAFDFSGQLERSSVSAADELFDGGKIKPLKPPPKSQYDGKPLQSPRSPRSPKQRFKQAFSPRRHKKDFDPFAAAMEQTRTENLQTNNDRSGRERTQNPTPSSSSRHKKTRSLSPFRVSDLLFDRDSNQETTNASSSSSSSLSSMISLWYRKWKLKDLFLFRSASEGRASNKDQLNKFMMKRSESKEDLKNSSFRSTGSSVGTSSSVSSSIRRRDISAHELHYTLNRAFSEEMKRKTFLPYRNNVLGCLGFIPTMDDSASLRGGAAASSTSSMSMARR